MPTTSATTIPASPAATWKALAHLIAARPKIRVWDPATNKFDRTKDLTSRLPHVPAAVLIYQHNRTHLLVLEFDTKRHGQHTVDADFTRALSWITDAGGLAVTDQSTSGGRHILVPLAIGTTATLAEIIHLMRLLEARLPSLDKTPMTNPKTGCITAPGSPCREGGHRILDGPLPAAIDAFTTRSHPGLLPRLNVLLGALHPSPTSKPTPPAPEATTGTGPHTRLRPEYTRTTDLPDRITAYATTGQLPHDSHLAQPLRGPPIRPGTRRPARPQPGHHPSPHRPRPALARRSRPPPTPDTGTRQKALQRDWHKALTWAATNTQFFRPARAQE